MSNPAPEFAPWLGVFETLRVINGVPLFMPEHLKELGRAMEALGLKSDFDFNQARTELGHGSGRWRWIVTTEDTRTLFTKEDIQPAEPVALSVSPVRVGSCNWDARYKTVSYLSHAQAGKMALTGEAILLNEYGHITSASRGNIFWRKGTRLFTPSHDSGCRRGVVRAFVLGRREVKISQYSSNVLLEADEIFLTNSIKGIISVNKLKTHTLKNFSAANELRQEYETEIASQVASA